MHVRRVANGDHKSKIYDINISNGSLIVERVDEDFVYCNYRLKKDILVSREEIANSTPKPGDKIVYKYEYFYINKLLKIIRL